MHFSNNYMVACMSLQTIESVDLEGKERKVLLRELPYPYGVTVWNGRLFWTDWQTRAIHEASQPKEKLKGNLVSVMDIHYFDLEQKGIINSKKTINAKVKVDKYLSHLFAFTEFAFISLVTFIPSASIYKFFSSLMATLIHFRRRIETSLQRYKFKPAIFSPAVA